MSTEQRKERATRVRISLPLQLQVGGAEILLEAEALNISRSGMLLSTSMPLELATELDLTVALADGQVLFRTRAEVVRQQLEGQVPCVGIQFLDLPDDAVALIDRLAADEASFGKYRLEALIGRGGMAEVFRARQTEGPQAGRIVAVKRLLPGLACDPMFVDLFVTEADVTRSLCHPSIVEVFETGAVADSFYIAMEFVDGGNVSQLLHACRQKGCWLPIELACFIALCVADALDYAHHATAPNGTPLGIIHCDVAPTNIFVSYAGVAKLADFGVAQLSTIPGPVDGRVLVGRPQYHAPEQILYQPLSPATDVFALGAVLFEMLTLHEAFAGDNPEVIHRKIATGDVLPPSAYRKEIPRALDQIVLCALSRRIRGALEPWWSGLKTGITGEGRMRHPDAASLALDLLPFCSTTEKSQDALRRYVLSLTRTQIKTQIAVAPRQ